jgi:hypothetical protein
MIQVGDNFSPNALSTSQSRIYISHPATSLPRYLYWSIRVIIENYGGLGLYRHHTSDTLLPLHEIAPSNNLLMRENL